MSNNMNSNAEDAASRIERMHRPLIEEGHLVLRHDLAQRSGILDPKAFDTFFDLRGDQSLRNISLNPYSEFYAIVNGLKSADPVSVNAGDAVSIVAVMEDRPRSVPILEIREENIRATVFKTGSIYISTKGDVHIISANNVYDERKEA